MHCSRTVNLNTHVTPLTSACLVQNGATERIEPSYHYDARTHVIGCRASSLGDGATAGTQLPYWSLPPATSTATRALAQRILELQKYCRLASHDRLITYQIGLPLWMVSTNAGCPAQLLKHSKTVAFARTWSIRLTAVSRRSNKPL